MKKGSVFTIIGLLLIAAALCLTIYNVLDSRRAGESADSVLAELDITPVTQTTPAPLPSIAPVEPDAPALPDEPAAPTEPVKYPDYVLWPRMDMPVKTVDGRDYIGVLAIPPLSLELPVTGDWTYVYLKDTPCRYAGSAYLDDMVIVAHNYDRHFGRLKNLYPGASVTFTDVDGNGFMYEVAEIETLAYDAIEEAVGSGYDLTLITCTVGGRSRVAVRCERIK